MLSLISILNSIFRLLLSNVFSLGIWVYKYELLFVCTSTLIQSEQVAVHGLGVDKLMEVSSEVSVRIYVCPSFDSGVSLT